jgi:hypothetical protein
VYKTLAPIAAEILFGFCSATEVKPKRLKRKAGTAPEKTIEKTLTARCLPAPRQLNIFNS